MSLSRRLFLGHLAAAAAAATAGAAGIASSPLSAAPSRAPVRLRSLRLATAAPLDDLERFYGATLGFETRRDARTVEVRGRDWSIAFAGGEGTEASVDGVPPHYHFAFNVPAGTIRAAHDWTAERAEIIVPPAALRDAGEPDGIVHFRHWDAHSVFFWDPAMNAVEFIERHTLDDAEIGGPARGAGDGRDRDGDGARDAFGPGEARTLSEIGLVAGSVETVVAELRGALDCPSYVGAGPDFHPLGDERGLLIVMAEGRRQAFEQGRVRHPYPVGVRLAGAEPGLALDVSGHPFRLES